MAAEKTKVTDSPESISKYLSNLDSTRGLPAGTMASIMKQETGGSDKYIKDPSAYHYALNADGQRIAGHTGKVSTASGPFGVLDSTAKDPGYGVAPRRDTSFEGQADFAANYAAARIKSAGSVVGGLAGYGEGDKYAQQVASRTGRAPPLLASAQAPPDQVAVQEPLPVAVNTPQEVVAQEAPPVQVAQGPDPWQAFLQGMQQPVKAQDLAYGPEPVAQMALPTYASVAPVGRTSMSAFAGLAPQQTAHLRNFNNIGDFDSFSQWGRAHG